MFVPYSHLALVIYPACLLWLVAFTLPYIIAPLKASAFWRALLFWGIMAFSYAQLSPNTGSSTSFFDFSGGIYGVLPLAALAVGIPSLLGLPTRWWQLVLLLAGTALIAADASYWPTNRSVLLLIVLAVSFAAWWALSHRPPAAQARGASHHRLTLALGGITLLAIPFVYTSGAVLAALVLALNVNGLVVAALTLRKDQKLWEDIALFLLVTAPALIAVEWAIFGY